MKKNAVLSLVVSLIIAGSLLFYSCQKELSGKNDNIPQGMNRLSVYLTDGPTDYQQVLLDIQRIEVKLDTCRRTNHGHGEEDNDDDEHGHPGCDNDHDSISSRCEIWDTLNINPGIYDVLKFRNGLDTLLGSGFLLNGKIERIKITLGSNNSVLVDSVSHPLQLIGNQNYVYVDIRREHIDSISSNNLQIFLDFNLDRSIIYFNGQYWLKPVVRPFGRHATGEIEGKVRPEHSHGVIKAFNATDTAFARPFDDDGEFKIRGLRDGIYSLFIDGRNGYRDTTINNIIVRRGRETDIGTIRLQH